MFRAIVYAEPKRKHMAGIMRELQKLRGRVQELEDAAWYWGCS